MAKSNTHPGNCLKCGKPVTAHAGFVERHNGRWFIRCRDCIKRNGGRS